MPFSGEEAERPERVVEAGIVLFALTMLAAGGALLYDRLVGGARNRGRHNEAPPQAGEVPPERHRNVISNSAR